MISSLHFGEICVDITLTGINSNYGAQQRNRLAYRCLVDKYLPLLCESLHASSGREECISSIEVSWHMTLGHPGRAVQKMASKAYGAVTGPFSSGRNVCGSGTRSGNATCRCSWLKYGVSWLSRPEVPNLWYAYFWGYAADRLWVRENNIGNGGKNKNKVIKFWFTKRDLCESYH
jgi:hypothetical protein